MVGHSIWSSLVFNADLKGVMGKNLLSDTSHIVNITS